MFNVGDKCWYVLESEPTVMVLATVTIETRCGLTVVLPDGDIYEASVPDGRLFTSFEDAYELVEKINGKAKSQPVQWNYTAYSKPTGDFLTMTGCRDTVCMTEPEIMDRFEEHGGAIMAETVLSHILDDRVTWARYAMKPLGDTHQTMVLIKMRGRMYWDV